MDELDRSVPAPSLASGEYRLRTRKAGLVAVAARLMAAGSPVPAVVDVPGEGDLAAWERLLETTDGVADGSCEEDWAVLAVPLVNAMRLAFLAGSASSFPGCRAFLMRCPPAVSWLALRNSLAAESVNRASGPAPGWREILFPIFDRDRLWHDVFVRISGSEAFAA